MQEATIEITFYFDPACPWTWLTSRWLVEAASVRSLSVKWAPLSLFLLNNGDVPESFRIPLAQSFKALRAIAQLASQDHFQEIARFYTTIGTSYHYKLSLNTTNLVQAAPGLLWSLWSWMTTVPEGTSEEDFWL